MARFRSLSPHVLFPLTLILWASMGVLVGWGSGWVAAKVFEISGLSDRWPWLTPTVWFALFITMGVVDGAGNAITRELCRRADARGLPPDPETPGLFTWGMWRSERHPSQ